MAVVSDEEQMRILSNNLKKLVSLSGKKQKEIAEELGYAVTTFNSWYTGNRLPTCGKVQKLADYFGVSKSDLLDDQDAKTQEQNFVSMFHRLSEEDKETILGKMVVMLGGDLL